MADTPKDLAEIALDLGPVEQHRLLRQHVCTLQQAVNAFETSQQIWQSVLVEVNRTGYAWAPASIFQGIVDVLTGQGISAPELSNAELIYVVLSWAERGLLGLANNLTVGEPTIANLLKINSRLASAERPRDAFIRELFDRALYTKKTARCRAVAYKRC